MMDDEQTTQGPHDGTSPVRLPGLDHVLAEAPGPAASPENLRGVLSHHLRRRRRLTSGIAAAVLAAGLGGGVAIGEAVAGGTLAASPKVPAATVPTGSGALPTTGGTAPATARAAAHAVAGAKAPAGLEWVASGSSSAASASASQPASSYSASNAATVAPVPSVCTIDGCIGSSSFYNLQPLLFRQVNGVEVRVFTQRFAFVPYRAGSGGTGYSKGGVSSSGGNAASGGAPTSGGGTPSSGNSAGTDVSPPASGSPAIAPSSATTPVTTSCAPVSALVVEVSDSKAVGEVTVPYVAATSRPIQVVADQIVGTAEQSPMAVLAVRVGAGVHSVTATFASGASDTMVVSGGWAVLVTTLPGPATKAYTAAAAHVVALSASGRTVERFAVPTAPAMAIPQACVGPVILPPSVPVTGGKIPQSGAGPTTKS